jgi:hypothetical protein
LPGILPSKRLCSIGYFRLAKVSKLPHIFAKGLVSMVKAMSKKSFCRSILCAAGFASVLEFSSIAHAQDLIFVNPADRGDGRASLVNPAVAAQQDRLFALGTRALYLGAISDGLDLTHSYFNLTFSHRPLLGIGDFGYGLQGQVLHMPEYTALALSGLLAKSFGDRIALGANIGITHRGFDLTALKSATEADRNDPLFQSLSKVVPEFGIGVIAVPSRFVTLGVSMNHLTHSNLSVAEGGQVTMPRALNMGMAVGYGNFRALFSLAYNERDLLPRFGVESFRERLGYMRVAVGREMAMFDTKLNVMEGIALNFRYNYPLNELSLATSGSPELGLEFNFDKNPSLYAMEWMEAEVPRRPAISLAHAFLVKSAFDTLFITKKIVKRIIDSSLVDQVQKVPKAIFFAAEQDSILPLAPEKIFLSEEELRNRPKIGAQTLLQKIEEQERLTGRFSVPRDSAGIWDEMKRNHKPEYMAAFRALAEGLKTAPKAVGNFVTPRDAKRTHLLLRFLSLYTTLNDELKVTVADSATAEHLNQEPETISLKNIAPIDSFLALRAYDKTRAPGRGLLVNAPADTFHFSLNLLETRRWGPVSGEFVVKNEKDNLVFRDATIVGQSEDHNQIKRRLDWNWKLADGSYLPEGTYYYYIEWLSADGKRYRSPENKFRVVRNLITSSIRLSKTMPEPNPDARLRTLIRMN